MIFHQKLARIAFPILSHSSVHRFKATVLTFPLKSVRISTSPVSSTIEGTLFTACPITNLVAINTADGKQAKAGDYHIIPISRIQSFQIVSLAQNNESTSFADAVPSLHALDIRALKAREANAVGKLQESEARRGKGVTREAQDIFDAFSRTMPTRWDGSNIIVADAVAIGAPYRVDDCRPLVAGDTAALTRVRKVVRQSHSFSFPSLIPLNSFIPLTSHSSRWNARRSNCEMPAPQLAQQTPFPAKETLLRLPDLEPPDQGRVVEVYNL
jgi:hypothetical protein